MGSWKTGNIIFFLFQFQSLRLIIKQMVLKFFYRKIPVIGFLFFIFIQNAYSQGYYPIIISSPDMNGTDQPIETDNGCFLLPTMKCNNWCITSTQRGYIFKIDAVGDTSSVLLNKGDTIRYLNEIVELGDNQFLGIGTEVAPPYDNFRLLVIKFEIGLNTIWVKSYAIDSNYRFLTSTDILKKSGGGYFIVGDICLTSNPGFSQPYLFSLSSEGDLISMSFLTNLSVGCHLNNSMFSPDSTQFWLFGTGILFNTGCCLVQTDTLFNLINIKPYPEHQKRPLTAKMLYPDSIITSALYTVISQPQEDQIGISIMDTNLTSVPIHYFGTADTIDYPADGTSLDFHNPDSIFYAGTHNIIFGYWNEGVSWIMTGLLDRNLELRYEHYFGGDAYYRTNQIISTSSGGSFIIAAKFWPSSENNDLLIFKLDPDGLLVSLKETSILQMKQVLIYPNPSEGYFNIRAGLKNASIGLYDIFGQKILETQLNRGVTRIDCPGLTSGLYIYKISHKGKTIECGKWMNR